MPPSAQKTAITVGFQMRLIQEINLVKTFPVVIKNGEICSSTIILPAFNRIRVNATYRRDSNHLLRPNITSPHIPCRTAMVMRPITTINRDIIQILKMPHQLNQVLALSMREHHIFVVYRCKVHIIVWLNLDILLIFQPQLDKLVNNVFKIFFRKLRLLR